MPLLLSGLVGAAVPIADAAPRGKKAAAAEAKGDPALLPPDKAQNLVNAGKITAFYDRNHLGRAPVLSAKSAALIDYDTGEVLWEKNGTLRVYPASTTKILTGLLLAEKTEPGDVITCLDPKIREIEPSSLHIQPWEKFTSKDLLYGTMLRSANDGSVVIAQHVGGSVAKFADLMNQRAREAGATDTHFTNPNGLPDDQHWTTARDMALIARVAMQNERFEEAVSERKRKIARSKVTQDVLVSSKAKKFYDEFPGADGIKTGYTRAARHCFVGSATWNGRRLIGVIMGAGNNASGECMPLLGWGFRRFPAVVVAKKGESVATLDVRGGVSPQVPAVAAENLRAVLDAANPTRGKEAVSTEVRGASHLVAPVRQGQEVGSLFVKVAGRDQGSVPLYAAADVAEAPSIAARLTGGSVSGSTGTTTLVLWGTGVGVSGLIGWAYYATASAKTSRRRRHRLATAGRGDHRGGAGGRRR